MAPLPLSSNNACFFFSEQSWTDSPLFSPSVHVPKGGLFVRADDLLTTVHCHTVYFPMICLCALGFKAMEINSYVLICFRPPTYLTD